MEYNSINERQTNPFFDGRNNKINQKTSNFSERDELWISDGEFENLAS